MELNLKYYKGNDKYSDGSVEQEIIDYEKIYEENLSQILENDIRWPVFYHLTPIRENIINWYPFKKDAEVLEIGAGMGAITGILCDKVASVTAVELSKQRATSILTRNSNRENLEIIVGNLNDIKFDKKFDYITLIGVLEYAMSFTDTNNPYVDFLKNIKKLLKDDGKLLIAIENKYGMKYFAGVVEDHTNRRYDGITGYDGINSVRTFGKEEIKDILKEAGYSNTNFYYPLPDYKLPSVIYSDKYMPKVDEDIEYVNYYYEGSVVNFDEKRAYKEAVKNRCLDIFANSFFIEASSVKIDNPVTFAKFDNLLNEENKTIEIVKNARRFKIAAKSNNRFNKIKDSIDILNKCKIATNYKVVNNEIEITSVNKENSLYEKIVDSIKKNKLKDAILAIKAFEKFIEKNLKTIDKKKENTDIFFKYNVAIEEEKSSKLVTLKNGFFDLDFSKVYIDGKSYIFEDVEEYCSELPLKFATYLCIKRLATKAKVEEEKITNIYNEMAITEEYIKPFDELEEKLNKEIQERIIDKGATKFFDKTYQTQAEIMEKVANVDKLIEENEELKEKVKKLSSKKKKGFFRRLKELLK